MARSRQIVSWALVPWLAAGIPACGGGRAPSPGTSAPEGGEPLPHPFESSKRPAEPSSPAKALPPEARAAVPEGGAVALPAPSDAAAGEQTDARREPSCVPEAGPDEPDDQFADSNCDGIDGDASSAIFVAPTGSDRGAGTMDAPVRTITAAIRLATAQSKSVYVCSAKYEESVDITEVSVSMYGGYACDTSWRRGPDRASVRPASGVPLTVRRAPSPMVIDRIAFRAVDGEKAGESSVAATVIDSPSVRFVRVLLAAGNAMNGTSGAAVADPGWAPQEPAADAAPVMSAADCRMCSQDGSHGSQGCELVAPGATGPKRACPRGGGVQGGDGGNGGNVYLGALETVGVAGYPSGSEHDGSSSRRRDAGALASAGFGEIVDGQYVATNSGENGALGFRGHAGKGGNGGISIASDAICAHYMLGGGGGQGGYPGCGGEGGKRGKGGGASIALISSNSGVTLEWSTVLTGRGGNGGDGSDGAPGQPGGPGGKGAQDAACIAGEPGGRGGDGGQGGTGGPGGGGPSIGVVSVGKVTRTASVTFELGNPGRGGASSEATAPDGIGEETYSVDLAGAAGK